MEEKVFNVSQVNKYVKMLIDSDAFLNNINITGEITNFKAHYTGHFYFTLKDENSSIKCVMFKSAAQLVKFKPEDGMKVVISGQINVFERDGVYQIYCRTMKQAGLGELYIAYEKLKKRLQDEGLFDEIYKKKIPFLPDRVGVITSKTGAVIKDIINEAVKNVSMLSELKNIEIIVSGDDSIKTICDLKWQVEAITNILKNCIEHSYENRKIYINYNQNNMYTELKIEDNGTGIDAKDLPHIFERFYKGKNSSSDSVGIGLALSKSIIESNNGYIQVDSELNKGTTFIIKYLK